MHAYACRCAACLRGAAVFEVLEFGREGGGAAARRPFGAAEESQLALELMAVSSEAELDRFLGELLRAAWRGARKSGAALAGIAAPLGGALKAAARGALPFAGGAPASRTPVPGVGTALGGALRQALEAQLGGMAYEERAMEMARRFVRVAGTAARLAADGEASPAALRAALERAVRQHAGARAGADMEEESGRWRRRGDRIVVRGAW